MAGRTDVDPEGVFDAGGKIRQSAQQLRTDLQSFQGELAGFGEPWGSDDIGSLIGMCYAAIRDVAMESFQDNIDGVDEHGDGVQAMAVNYQDSDQRGADRMRGAGGPS